MEEVTVVRAVREVDQRVQAMRVSKKERGVRRKRRNWTRVMKGPLWVGVEGIYKDVVLDLGLPILVRLHTSMSRQAAFRL
jgi:hypothetical protein